MSNVDLQYVRDAIPWVKSYVPQAWMDAIVKFARNTPTPDAACELHATLKNLYDIVDQLGIELGVDVTIDMMAIAKE